jgi:hypothetical protein
MRCAVAEVVRAATVASRHLDRVLRADLLLARTRA